MKSLAEFYRLKLAEVIHPGDVTPVMCFPIGSFHSAKYPDLDLTEQLAEELIANFEAAVLGREPVVDSSGRHDTSAPAAGWVKRTYLGSYEEGDVTGMALWADVQWTALGAQLLNDNQYRYSSVEIGPVTLNDSGDVIDNVLRSLTLTNTPVLSMMGDVKDAAAKLKVVATLSEFTLVDNDPNVGGGVDRDRIPAADFAGPNRSFPIVTPKDVADAARSIGRSKGDPATIKANIIRIAKRKGAAFVAKLPEAWKASESDGGTPIEPSDHGVAPDPKDDPVNGLLADFADWHAKLKTALKGQPGNSAVHASIKACRDQLAEFCDGLKTSEGTPGPTEGRSAPASQHDSVAKGAEGHPTAGASPQKGGESTMITVIQKLNLAEDASEAVVLAEVTKLVERNTALEAELAETRKASALAAITMRLDEAVAAKEILPAEKDEQLVKFAESPAAVEGFLAARKGIEVGPDRREQGSDPQQDRRAHLSEGKIAGDAAKALSEARAAYMAEHSLEGAKGLAKADKALRLSNPDLYTEYAAYLAEQHIGAVSGDV